MKRLAAILLLALFLTGCRTLGNVVTKTGKVLMDPSVPVGAPEDRPTQIALSLYAGRDVNPNPAAVPVEAAGGSTRRETLTADVTSPAGLTGTDGPFVVNFRSSSRVALIKSLQGLLDYLGETTSVPLPTDDQWQPGKFRFDRQPAADQPALRPPLPFTSSGLDASVAVDDIPLPLSPGDDVSGGGETGTPVPRALGQYGQGLSLQDTKEAAVPVEDATPVAFKILQLKDDSLLLNADPEQLRKDLKKVLGSTYVASDDYLLLPGQFKFVDFTAIKDDTRYVAVVADFHARDGADWKQAIRLEPKGRKYALLVTLQGKHVAITDETIPATSSTQP